MSKALGVLYKQARPSTPETVGFTSVNQRISFLMAGRWISMAESTFSSSSDDNLDIESSFSSSSDDDSDIEPVQSLIRRSEDLGEDLLPGLRNDITLELIIPKLAWKDFRTLFLVSYSWQKALRSHLVHDARVRAGSTETVHAILSSKHVRKADSRRVRTIFLLYMRDRSWEELPPTPRTFTGIRKWSQCVSVEDKLYILGGVRKGLRYSGSTKVYMLNLAGSRSWKRCADMTQPRLRFGCGVKDGKIYVCGGVSLGTSVRGCEVYDPKVGTWSRIEPMTSFRLDSRVAVVGEELVVHSGSLCISQFRDISNPSAVYEAGLSLEMYNPARDEWSSSSLETVPGAKFFAKGQIYTMTKLGIFLHHSDKSWKYFQLHSFAKYGEKHSHRFVGTVLPSGKELLASIRWYSNSGPVGGLLLQSRGFGIYKDKVEWEELVSLPSGPFNGQIPQFTMHSIQL